MADSRRELLAKYLVTQLEAVGKPDGLLVGRQRSLPLDATLLPAAIVYLMKESAQRIVGRSILVRRDVVFRVELRVGVEGELPIDQLLDPLIQWVVQQATADFKCGGLAHEIEELGSQWSLTLAAAEGDITVGACAVDFQIRYYTKVNDLTTT